MTDVILVFVIVAFFGAMSLLVRAAGHVIRDADDEIDTVLGPEQEPAA